MLHFKCVACRLRLASPVTAQDPAGELCPGCGSSLEPVGSLTEIVGFQSIGAERPAERATSHWLDQDGGFSPESVAAALASLGVGPGARP